MLRSNELKVMERKVKTLTPMYNQQDDPTIMLSKQKGFTVSITILFHEIKPLLLGEIF